MIKKILTNIGKKSKSALAHQVETKKFLGIVFEKMINEKKLNIFMGPGNQPIEPWSPFMNEKIRKNVKQFCISIWLDLSSEEIFTRTIKFNKRPLLKNIKSKDDIEKLYSKRRNTYSLADHKIDCNGKSEVEVVNKIKEIYENI